TRDTASTSTASCSCPNSARTASRSSPRSRSVPSRCWIARSPKWRRVTTTSSRRWRSRSFRNMATAHAYSEVVEAEGHLIDSQILNAVFDTVVKSNATFDVLKFDIGRSNDAPSFISMRISAPTEQILGQVLEELVALGCRLAEQHDALLRQADRDGCVPDDFYSTTNHRTHVRHGGHWIEVERQRMDAVIIVAQGRAICRKLRDVITGDAVICGVGGVRVSPQFRDRDRLGFAFMTNEIS